MNWAALLGGLIGGSIPAILTYIGVLRGRQSTNADVFGPALLLLYRMQPDFVMANITVNAEVQHARLAEVSQLTDTARERLLLIRAGHPRRHVRELADTAQVKLGRAFGAMGWQVSDMLGNKDNPEWVEHYRVAYAEADLAMRELIDANFAWGFPRPAAIVSRVRSWWRNGRTSNTDRAWRRNRKSSSTPPRHYSG
jgi:hypothetical protein